MKKTLLIGYGNPDRGDDGVAWHFLNRVLKEFDCKEDDLFSDEVIHIKENLDIWFNFQLLPEMAETIPAYERVIFIDAHTGNVKEDINLVPLEPQFQNSPLTHHFTPPSCLALVQEMKGKCPESWLLSVRGYQFAFNRQLSSQTQILIDEAFQKIKGSFLE
jgi:hydrogenase maturation protease